MTTTRQRVAAWPRWKQYLMSVFFTTCIVYAALHWQLIPFFLVMCYLVYMNFIRVPRQEFRS